jgi:uncharacterized repeat protein (TIGR03803 family)
MEKPTLPAFALLALLAAGTGAHAQTFSVLYNFGSRPRDPQNPNVGLIAQGRDGNLYSTTPYGGVHSKGAVFTIAPTGRLSLLHSFAGTDGSVPQSGLSLGTNGNFYGTTMSGGTHNYGTVFSISSSGSLTVLHNFTNGTDGATPLAAPIEGADGSLYGTTWAGGAHGCGTVYRISRLGTLTPLLQFNNSTACNSPGPLVQGADGNFYGITINGPQIGPVFYKITPAGKFTVLNNNFPDGMFTSPQLPLAQGSNGNFYGDQATGTGVCNFGCGAIFKLTPEGSYTVLHAMNATTDGAFPANGLAQATDGNFYGFSTAAGNGSCRHITCSGYGTIFKISPQGVFSVLYDFHPTTGTGAGFTLLQHTNGLLYGARECGGFGSGTDPYCPSGGGVFYSWDAGFKPFVSLLPSSGKVGKRIDILGQGFTGAKNVYFHGISASFTVVSDTYLTATVPSGTTTGFVRVSTPGGELKSNKKFVVTP